MLKTLSEVCEIIVFTASHECYASKVLDWIDPTRKLIHHRLFRESCSIVEDGLHVKDLRVLGNRDLKDVLIIDNAAYSYCFHLKNGVPIIPFYDNAHDRELTYLTSYLKTALA
jgi:CTD small phosphatase-like protein 2